MTAAPPPSTPPPPPLESPSWQPPGPPDSPPPARPPLRRSGTNRLLGGVAGGLAEYSGIDALLWRVGFVALTFAGGTGIAVYLLLWLLMPGDAAGGLVAPDRTLRPQPGPRSPVPGLTVATMLIVVGALVLLSRVTGWDPEPRGFLGSALLILGLGLMAAAFSGGRTARGGLIVLGIVLSIALAAASTEPWHHYGAKVGDRTYHPTSATDVPATYKGGVGNLTVDLTDVALGGTTSPITTRLDAGVGNVRVVLPSSADVQVTVDEGIGNITVFGAGSSHGGFFRGAGSAPWTGDGRPEFVLTVDSGIGNVEVSRG